MLSMFHAGTGDSAPFRPRIQYQVVDANLLHAVPAQLPSPWYPLAHRISVYMKLKRFHAPLSGQTDDAVVVVGM